MRSSTPITKIEFEIPKTCIPSGGYSDVPVIGLTDDAREFADLWRKNHNGHLQYSSWQGEFAAEFKKFKERKHANMMTLEIIKIVSSRNDVCQLRFLIETDWYIRLAEQNSCGTYQPKELYIIPMDMRFNLAIGQTIRPGKLIKVLTT